MDHCKDLLHSPWHSEGSACSLLWLNNGGADDPARVAQAGACLFMTSIQVHLAPLVGWR